MPELIRRKDLLPPSAYGQDPLNRSDDDLVGITWHYTTGQELGNWNTLKWWRNIHDYHVSGPYSDIAYNFGFDVFGRLLEGRPVGAPGAHTYPNERRPALGAGWPNQHTLGVAFLGNDDYGVWDLTVYALEAMKLVTNLVRLRTGRWPFHYIHKDWKGTQCPGNEMLGFVNLLVAGGYGYRG